MILSMPPNACSGSLKLNKAILDFRTLKRRNQQISIIPPKVKGEKSLRAPVEITQQCLEYLAGFAKKTAKNKVTMRQTEKIEFLVSSNGKASNFYLLRSVGKCNKTLAKSLEQATFIPATAGGEPVPTLVRFYHALRLEGVTYQQENVIMH